MAKIPKGFDEWLLKQKNRQGIYVGDTHFFWEIMCWAAYRKGKRAGVEQAHGQGFNAGRAYQSQNPRDQRVIVKPERT